MAVFAANAAFYMAAAERSDAVVAALSLVEFLRVTKAALPAKTALLYN